MQGIFIVEPGLRERRPKSKKEIRELVKGGEADRIVIESTSLFGNESGGSLTSVPAGRIDFVGPDPYTKRNFYGNIFVKVAADGTRSYTVK